MNLPDGPPGLRPTLVPRHLWICLGLALAVALIYGQTGRADFLNFDDPWYLTRNPRVLAGLTWGGVRWAFTSFWASNWHPLTWLSHMADVSLFGADAGRMHLVSAAFHAGNGILLFLLFRTMTGSTWRSGLLAALFAVHPLHVESVAWLAERKDLLSTFLALLSLHAYVRYTRGGSRASLALAAIWYAAALMAKPVPVSLPLLMLLLDHWPLGRTGSRPWRTLVVEKWVFLLLAAGSCAMTMLAQRTEIFTLEQRTFGLRLLNACWAYVRYLQLTLWPSRLMPIYPAFYQGEARYLLVRGPLALLVILGVTALAVARRRKQPYLLVGWLWYLVALVPMIGLVQVGLQALADRYTYVPLIGPFAALAWGAAEACRAWRIPARVQAVAAGGALAGLAATAWVQTGHWRSSEALFRHAVAVVPGSATCWANLGESLISQGRDREALACFQQARSLWPGWGVPYRHIGFLSFRLGDRSQGLQALARGLALTPDDPDMLRAAAWNLALDGRLEEAVLLLRRFLALEPQRLAKTLETAAEAEQSRTARIELGQCCRQLGWTKEACRVLEEARRRAPGDPEVLLGLGLALGEAGRRQEALAVLRQCAALRPDWPEPQAGLARLLDQPGRRIPAPPAPGLRRAVPAHAP